MGPGFELVGVDLRIASGFFDKLFAGEREVGKTVSVHALGRGLRFDAAAIFRLIELVGGEVAQLLVGFVQLQFAIADFERDVVPAGELFGHPNGVLLRTEDVEGVGRRVNALTVGKIIFRENAELDRLRFDAERFGAEGAGKFQRRLIVAAGAEE